MPGECMCHDGYSGENCTVFGEDITGMQYFHHFTSLHPLS